MEKVWYYIVKFDIGRFRRITKDPDIAGNKEDKPGVYAIFCKDTGETLYVGRTKNIRQRLYNNHLHGPFTNARLKKYLVEDPAEVEINDIGEAKDYLLKNCYFQYSVEEDTMKRGRLEGLLSYLFNVRYMYEEH